MPKKSGKKGGRQRKAPARKPPVPGRKPGRPFKEVNPPPIEIQIEILASYYLTNDEISAVLDIPLTTLKRNYGPAIKKGRDNGSGSLKRKQFQIAMGGNVTMLIWLGKVYLGQREMREPPPPDDDTTYVYETQWGSLDESADQDS